MAKIKSLAGEVWRNIRSLNKITTRNKYAVSNKGRILSYINDMEEDGKLLIGGTVNGYRILKVKYFDKKKSRNKGILMHRAVAEEFLPKPKAGQVIIHINHNKLDNSVKNIKWVHVSEAIKHQQKSPKVVAYRRKPKPTVTEGTKLTLSQVAKIKTLLSNKSNTLRKIADKYGVSDMQISRIRSGKNWKHVKPSK